MREDQIDWITKILFIAILTALVLSYKNWFADLYRFFLQN